MLSIFAVKEQAEREQPKYKAPPISGTVEERCLFALDHVRDGLKCLQYFPTEDNSDEEQKKTEEREKEKREYEETHPNVAKPFQAIPMPYVSLKQQENAIVPEQNLENHSPMHKKKNKSKKKRNEKNVVKEITNENALLCKPKVETLPTWQAPKKSDNVSWRAHLKTLLYEKMSLIYAVLAENQYINKNYGASLRCMLEVLYFQRILEFFCGVKKDKSISYLLGRAGDCCLMTVQDWCNIEKHKKDYEGTKGGQLDGIDDLVELYNMEQWILRKHRNGQNRTIKIR